MQQDLEAIGLQGRYGFLRQSTVLENPTGQTNAFNQVTGARGSRLRQHNLSEGGVEICRPLGRGYTIIDEMSDQWSPVTPQHAIGVVLIQQFNGIAHTARHGLQTHGRLRFMTDG
ncbi:MAG TPA: hypothetical protein VMV35_12045, partial [Halothiobacillus sp.]|nr:hypothetical protein [Halothiobacillus sp.]